MDMAAFLGEMRGVKLRKVDPSATERKKDQVGGEMQEVLQRAFKRKFGKVQQEIGSPLPLPGRSGADWDSPRPAPAPPRAALDSARRASIATDLSASVYSQNSTVERGSENAAGQLPVSASAPAARASTAELRPHSHKTPAKPPSSSLSHISTTSPTGANADHSATASASERLSSARQPSHPTPPDLRVLNYSRPITPGRLRQQRERQAQAGVGEGKRSEKKALLLVEKQRRESEGKSQARTGSQGQTEVAEQEKGKENVSADASTVRADKEQERRKAQDRLEGRSVELSATSNEISESSTIIPILSRRSLSPVQRRSKEEQGRIPLSRPSARTRTQQARRLPPDQAPELSSLLVLPQRQSQQHQQQKSVFESDDSDSDSRGSKFLKRLRTSTARSTVLSTTTMSDSATHLSADIGSELDLMAHSGEFLALGTLPSDPSRALGPHGLSQVDGALGNDGGKQWRRDAGGEWEGWQLRLGEQGEVDMVE